MTRLAPDPPFRLAITGRAGRMSARLRDLASADSRFELIGSLGARGGETALQRDVRAAAPVHVVVDFTNESGANHALALARAAGAALLVGTTGLPRGILDEMGDLARSRPVMIAPNTSLGAAVMTRLVEIAARCLSGRCDIDIIERHHVHKRDAPSGTARRLADAIGRATGAELPPERIHAVRAGAIIGEHEAAFTAPEEILKIFHQATSRDVFARGALDIAAWLPGRPPGMYGIDDVLGWHVDGGTDSPPQSGR